MRRQRLTRLTMSSSQSAQLTPARQRLARPQPPVVPVDAVPPRGSSLPPDPTPVAPAPASSKPAQPTAASPANLLIKLLLGLTLAALAFLAYTSSGFAGERTFSMKQLAAYDGSNEALPVYISIDGVVYDVSANRRVYGKGGSYNMM